MARISSIGAQVLFHPVFVPGLMQRHADLVFLSLARARDLLPHKFLLLVVFLTTHSQGFLRVVVKQWRQFVYCISS